jgi:hypothetical protein
MDTIAFRLDPGLRDRAKREAGLKRLLATVVLALASVAAIGVGSAAADPVKNPNAIVDELTCDGETFDVVLPGFQVVGNDLDSTRVGVLLGFIDPDGNVNYFVRGFDPSELTACTAPGLPGWTIYVLLTPRR